MEKFCEHLPYVLKEIREYPDIKQKFACWTNPDNLLIIQGKQKSCQTLHAIALLNC